MPRRVLLVLSLGIPDVVRSRLDRGTLALILSIVPGLGHIYLGSAKRGIAILVIGIGLVLIAYPGFASFQYASGAMTTTTITIIALVMAGLGAIGFWIWQILDARKLAKQEIEV